MQFSRRWFLYTTAMLLAVSAWATDPFQVPDFHSEELIGTWTCSYFNTRHTVYFAKDQSFKGICLVGDKVSDRYEGKWKLVVPYIGSPELIWKYVKSGTLPTGSVDRDQVEILNKKLLVVWTKDGRRHAYQKVVSAANK